MIILTKYFTLHSFIKKIFFYLNLYKFKKEEKKIIKTINKKYYNYYILLSTQSYGECFITASLMKEFVKLNSGHIVLILKNKQIAEVVLKFKEISDTIITSNKYTLIKFLIKNSNAKIIKGHIFSLNKQYYQKHFASHCSNILDFHKFLLFLNKEATPTKLQIEKEFIRNMRNKHNIKSNTVLLSPYANSLNYKVLSANFWKELANTLIALNFNIIFNSNTKEYAKYKCIFEPILDTIAIAECCYYCVAFRSGLADILAATISKKMFIIYPSNTNQIHLNISNNNMNNFINNLFTNTQKTLAETNMDIHSLKTMYKKKNIKEVLFNGNEKVLISNVLDFIKI